MKTNWKIWYMKDRHSKAPLVCWVFEPDDIALEEAGYDKKFHTIKSIDLSARNK